MKSKKKNPKKKSDYEVGSGNVFADLDLPNPEEYLLKAKLVSLINDAIDERGWTQKEAARHLSLKQPNISDLKRGALDHFSVERLLYLLGRLTHKVTITVRRKANVPPEEIVIATRQKVASELHAR
jgi:predicted XRE-type DNA-binding protein